MQKERIKKPLKNGVFYLLFFLLQLSFSTEIPEKGNEINSSSFALVLSGGGSKGIAQIGVLKALDEAGLKPDLVVGTSMGALIGSLYATGVTSEEIDSLVKIVNWNEIYSNTVNRKKLFVSQKSEPRNYLLELRFNHDFKPTPISQSYGQYIYDLLIPKLVFSQFQAKGDFDSLYIPLRVVATNLLTGQKIVFSKGNLATAVRASCSVPLLFSPVKLDSFLLVDGGLSSNIPIQTAKDNGARFIVAVDVTAPLRKESDLDNPLHLVDQIISIGITHQKIQEKRLADIIITPDLQWCSNTDFDNIDSLIASGYNAAIEAIPEIKAGLKNLASSPPATVQKSFIEAPELKNLIVHGNKKTSNRIIQTAAAIKKGERLTPETLQKCLSSLYSTELFESVNLEMDSDTNLHVLVTEKQHWRVRMGLRFDEFHLGEGFIQPAYENLLGLGINTDLHIQLGMRREKYALEFKGNQLFTSNFSNTVNIQFYSSKESIIQREIHSSFDNITPDTIILNERTLRKSGISGLLGTQLGKWSQLCGGIKIERFKVQQSQQSPITDLLGLQFSNSHPSFILKLIIDTMDKFPFPTSGVKHYFTAGVTGKKYSDIKLNGSIGRYFTFYDRHTIFPQVRFCWANDALSEIEQVSLGGSAIEERYRDISLFNNIPFIGLPPLAFPGDILGLSHLEYRVQIQKNFYAQLIADWGYTWQEEDFKYKSVFNDFVNNALLGLGVALVIETRLGPVRFSYGQLLNDLKREIKVESGPQFYFSAGHDF